MRQDDDILTLEVLTVNYDGKPTNWRFYDGDIEFAATVEDEAFLSNVKKGKYKFGRGDMLDVQMRTIQRRPNKRLVTERIILETIGYIPYED